MTDSSLKVPVLLLTFNRPDETNLVFDEIRRAQPSRLYISSDGPRSDVKEDDEKVREVRKIVERIDWTCDVFTKFREHNVGGKICSSAAISWFFDNEKEGIILEDDCIPSQSFFLFCQELLGRFRSDKRVWFISGNNFQPGRNTLKTSYYFSKYPHCWGWAAWKRTWDIWDDSLTLWPQLRATDFLKNLSDGNKRFINFWEKKFDDLYFKKIDHWDYKLTYSIWTEGGVCILPKKNLVSNIGFGKNASNTKNKASKQANIPHDDLKFPLTHPKDFTRNISADRYTDNTIFSPSLLYKIKRFFLSNAYLILH